MGKYQDTAVEYAQQGYDQMQEYVRSNFNDYVEANNLTQVKPCVLAAEAHSVKGHTHLHAHVHPVLWIDQELCLGICQDTFVH